MALPAFSAATDWSQPIEDVAAGYRNVIISIYDVDGSVFTPLVAERPARFQQIQSPIQINDGGGWGTKHNVLFEYELRAEDPPITKGLLVRVDRLVDPAKGDPHLVHYAFIVASSIGSSETSTRTVKATTDMAVVPPVVP